MEHVAAVIAGIAPHDSPERFRALGVDVILGQGCFTSGSRFEVAGRTLTARAFVLATGSRAAVPTIPGLDDVPYLTNETVFDLREAVPSLAIVGAGPGGCELGQAMQRLGSEVLLLDVAPGILPREDDDMAAVVRDTLAEEGMRLALATSIERVARDGDAIVLHLASSAGPRAVRVSHLLIATGRAPNLEDLGLAAAGVAVHEGTLVVSPTLRTTNPRVFAIGDVAGPLQFTHVAEHHAGVVLRQALFRMKWARPAPVVPWCTYTDPELARVGLSEREAKARGVAHEVHRFAVQRNDRARAEAETHGLAKLVTDRRGRILGAAIAGPHAGELISEYALAMQHGLTAAAVAATIHPYPTWSETNRRVADMRLKAALTPARRRVLQRFLRLRGT